MVDGTLKENRLYIWKNISKDGNSRIEMTAPVEMEPLSQKINMTEPVLTEGNDNTWIVSFIMPNEFTFGNTS